MRVAIISGVRSAFVKANGGFSELNSLELAIPIVNELLKRNPWINNVDTRNGTLMTSDSNIIDANIIDSSAEIVFGSVLHNPSLPNLAREIVLNSQLSKNITGHYVSNNCITGLVATNSIAESIVNKRIEIGIAGGVETMSNPPLTFTKEGQKFFLSLNNKKTLIEKVKKLSEFRPNFVFPQIPSPKEPSTGLTMGEHCELMAKEFKISREDQDEFSLKSHKKAVEAQKMGIFDKEIVEIKGIKKDNLPRSDSNIEKLSKLKPVFDKSPTGTLTAGNSSSLTDGSSALLLASDNFVSNNSIIPMGYVSSCVYTSIDPSLGLLMAPFTAISKLLKLNNLKIDDIDIFEIHEAFAAQVLCTLKALKEGWGKFPNIKPVGEIDPSKINIYGGSVALGHPFAATGVRLILSCLSALSERKGKLGLISACAAGGTGCALLVRRV